MTNLFLYQQMPWGPLQVGLTWPVWLMPKLLKIFWAVFDNSAHCLPFFDYIGDGLDQ